jgi:hypothetical protein
VDELLIEYEPRLVEDAVLRALSGRAEEAEFRAERDPLYEIADPEEREARFRAFHAAWFRRLGLGQGIDEALQEQPSVAANVLRCLVAYTPWAREEGAELFVPSRSTAAAPLEPVVLIRLRPETLTLSDRLRALLRHELLHIVDMLDPDFGYEPWLPSSGAGRAKEQLVRDRYRVLWDAYIDGRLARLGGAPAGIRAERLSEFRRAFPMLGERAEETFEHFFEAASCRHAELMAFALDPVATSTDQAHSR